MPVNELELPTPLDGEEVKIAIAHKVAEAVMDALDKRCALYGRAYPKFKATFHVEYVLDNFGQTHEGSVAGDVPAQEHDGVKYVAGAAVEGVAEKVEGVIPETPPNVLRKQTGQAVPTQVIDERGIQSQKAVVYQPRTRGPRLGRNVPR